MRRFVMHIKSQGGATLVEVLVAIALAGILLPVLATALVTANAGRPATTQQLQASSLLREAIEAVRVRREAGWANIATDGTYFPAISGSTWTLTAGTQTTGGFTRQIVISSVQRNASGTIVASGGTVDPSTKKVVATVSWTTPYSSSVSSEAYFTRWQNDTTWTQTTQTDFNAGTRVNTVTTNTAGGEVQLAAGNTPSWTSPQQVGTYNISGNTDANDVFVDTATDRAYVVNGAGLSIINVATPSAPALLGTYNAGVTVNGVYVSGNYAYLASTSNTAELTVVNVSNPASPSLASTLNLGDTNDATSVFVSGGYAYVGKVASAKANINEFYIVDVTTPTSIVLTGSLNLSGNINSIYVSGNYAYVATSITTAELTVINVTTKTTPTQAGVYNSAGTVAANDVYASGTTVYLVEASNASGAEFFIINAANPAVPSLVGTYEAGGAVSGVYVAGTFAFLTTAITNSQFRVLNIASPASPTLFGSYNTGNSENDLVVDDNNTVFIASQDNAAELTVIQRGLVAGGFQSTGTFESSTLDAGATVSFNHLVFTPTIPSGGSLRLQVATNTNNATWNYVGPDGTASTYFTGLDDISLNVAAGRYFRYKAFFTSDTSSTPVLSDVTVNYSP